MWPAKMSLTLIPLLLLALGLALEGHDVLLKLVKVFTLLLQLLFELGQPIGLVSAPLKLGGVGLCVRFSLLFSNPHGLLGGFTLVECVTTTRLVRCTHKQRP